MTRLFRFVSSSLVLIAGLLEKDLFRVCFFLFFVSVVPAIAAEQTSNPAAPSSGIPGAGAGAVVAPANLIRGFATNLANANAS